MAGPEILNMNKSIEKIYSIMPVLFQNAACSFYGYKESRVRFNSKFHKTLNWLMQSEMWSACEIEAYQNEKMKQLISHAYSTVPFYRDRMKSLKLTPIDFNTIKDLQKLPILTKEDVRNNLDRLISSSANKSDLVFRHTSGTTGKSLQFYAGKHTVAFQWAVWWRHRMRFGINTNSWHSNFTGKLAVPANQCKPPYWRWNLPLRQVIINMQHLTPNKIHDIIGFFNNHHFKYYSGYPSIIHSFASIAMEQGLNLHTPPKYIFTGAENVLSYQRNDIHNFTGATLTDQYGFTEGCGNASHCRELMYHEDFEFGIIECDSPTIDLDGRRKGKILCTGFASPEFPFIRYEVGDVGIWEKSGYKCKCGRQSSVLAGIDGRVDDYVVTPEGSRIMRFDYIFKDTLHIKESQITQKELGAITVTIVRRPDFGTNDEQYISQEIAKWISPRLKVDFEYVTEIEREGNGKFRAVKSLLN